MSPLNTLSSSYLQSIIGSAQTAAQDPMSIILGTLSSAGITTSGS
jgi:hypothetical protein